MNDMIYRQALHERIKETVEEGIIFSGMTIAEFCHLLVDEAPSAERWIPCSERLPEDCQRVLIQVINGNMYVINFSAVGETSHIVAWMPLPEPYKEEPDD